MKPNIVKYNPQEFTLEKFREVFTKLFYEQSERDKRRDITIYITGTEEQCKRTLKLFDDAVKKEASYFLR